MLIIFNPNMANAVAQHHGYSGAGALKADYGVGSNENMYRNTTTGEVIYTGLYGGWKYYG